jgi:2-dehydropantoate 2-reductase
MGENGKTRVAVVGPGAIGLAFAAAAQEAGHEVLVCGRRPLGADPEIALSDGRSIGLRAPVVTDPSQAGGVADVVLFAVKAHQTQGAAHWLEVLCGPQTLVAVLQNGVEHEAAVKPYAPDASVLPVAVWAPGEVVAPGRVRVPGPAKLVTTADEKGRRLADLFEGSFAEVELSDDLDALLWAKEIPIAVIGLTVLTGRTGQMFTRPDMAELGLAYARECAAVARAAGVHVADSVVEGVVDLLIAHSAEKTSMLVDREAGRQLEWDARNGVIQRLGERHGVPTPISDVVVPLLAAASDGP